TIKSKNQRSIIETILNLDNVEVSGSMVLEVFVKHYEQFLGSDMECANLNVEGLFFKTIHSYIAGNMVEKDSGPDEFTSLFFKKGWDIIGDDICNAVRDFFSNGKLLKEINHTFLALIPKVSTPLRVNDCMPISCCNAIYKCVSKILTNRIIEGIKEVVSDNQSAFIPGRRISDNILITPRDIAREGFHLKNKVVDLLMNGLWAWPQSGLHKAPYLGIILAHVLDILVPDKRQWCDRSGNVMYFFVAKAWEAIRNRRNQVDWYRIVWFPHNIPRHAFHIWLVMRNGLKTHDKMRQSDVGPNGDPTNLRCPLYDGQPDSHPYLFFDCTFLAKMIYSILLVEKPNLPKSSWMLLRNLNWHRLGSKSSQSMAHFCNVLPHVKNVILSIMPFAAGDLHKNRGPDSLWVRWIHTYKLQGWSFWDVHVKSDTSWGVEKASST
nr:methylenetetrahydrofolate reductase 1 [Tanacetum cinerariifolium]